MYHTFYSNRVSFLIQQAEIIDTAIYSALDGGLVIMSDGSSIP